MNSIITNLLFSSLFFYSFASINFRGVEEFSWIPNLLGLILCVSFILNNPKIKFNYSLVILGIFIFWNLISAFINPDLFRFFITSVLIFVLSFIVYNICLKYPESSEYIKWAFILSLFIQIWISNNYIQYTEWGTVDRHKGTLGNANLYALFINIAFIFLLQKIGKPNNIIKYLLIFSSLGLVFFEIINTGSRKGIFFTILIIIFYYFSSIRKIGNLNKVIYFIIGLFILSQFALYTINSPYFYRFFESFYYNDVSLTDLHRYALAQDGIRLFYERPIFGWGADGFRYFNNVDFTYSHMNFLELLVNYGIIGFILFYSMYFVIFKNFKALNSYEEKFVISDKYIFVFFLIVTLILDIGMVRIFERMYWLIISMYLGKFDFRKT